MLLKKFLLGCVAATGVYASANAVNPAMPAIVNYILDESYQPSYHGVQNPGYYWVFSPLGSKVVAENVTLGLSIAGTYKTLTGEAAGFTEFTMDTGDKAYGIVVAGQSTYTAIAPFMTREGQYVSTQPIIAAISKDMTCDDIKNSMPYAFSGVVMPDANWRSQDTVENVNGISVNYKKRWAAFTGEITLSGENEYTVGGSNYHLDGSLYGNFVVTGSCLNGVITLDVGEGGSARISLSKAGMLFIDNLDLDDTTAIGFKSDTNIVLNDMYGMDFLGMQYHPYQCTGVEGDCSTETLMMKGVLAQDGKSVNVTYFTNIAEGTVAEAFILPLSFDGEIVPGLVKGTVTDADGTHDALWTVRKIDGKYQMILMSDNWYSYKGHNIFVIEK